jgi:hypothetical protein
MITIAHIFYNQHHLLPFHAAAWDNHPPHSFRYAIIDDASPTRISSTFTNEALTIHRIIEDVPWNIAGARNLAFHSAETDWVLCADIDHVVTPKAAAQVCTLNLEDPNTAYILRRKDKSGYIGVDSVINILMNKMRFFELGGYDEDYSGNYGCEETFFLRCLKYHRIQRIICDDIFLDWYPRLGKTQNLPRNKTFNAVRFQDKVSQLENHKYVNGPLLRFRWESSSTNNGLASPII